MRHNPCIGRCRDIRRQIVEPPERTLPMGRKLNACPRPPAVLLGAFVTTRISARSPPSSRRFHRVACRGNVALPCPAEHAAKAPLCCGPRTRQGQKRGWPRAIACGAGDDHDFVAPGHAEPDRRRPGSTSHPSRKRGGPRDPPPGARQGVLRRPDLSAVPGAPDAPGDGVSRTVSDAAKALGIDISTASRNLAVLARQGYVKRRRRRGGRAPGSSSDSLRRAARV